MMNRMLKKQTALLSAVLTVFAVLPAVPVCAADAPSVLILGDSISDGTGLKDGEHGYYDYLADCTGGTLTNLAKSGMTTADVIAVIENADNKDTIADADIICISAGGNDLMQPLKAYIDTKAKEGESIIDTAKRLASELGQVNLAATILKTLKDFQNVKIQRSVALLGHRPCLLSVIFFIPLGKIFKSFFYADFWGKPVIFL